MIDYSNVDVVVLSGFSATLKSRLTESNDRICIPSPNKFMHDLDKECFKWNADVSPLHTLSAQMFVISLYPNQKLIIERSMYDFLFFLFKIKAFEYFQSESDIDLPKLEESYNNLFGGRSVKYLVMENRANGFLTTNVFKGNHWTRSDLYTDVQSYRGMSDQFISYVTSKLKDYDSLVLTDDNVVDFIENPNSYVKL